MIYNYKKDYQHIFDTPARMEQESVIVNKIIDLLNKNKYDNIYDFISKNHTYQDFIKNNNLVTVLKHFGNTLSEEDFIKIQNELVRITELKKSTDKEGLKTTNIDDKQFVTYEGKNKNFYLDNSYSSLSIEREVEEMQKTQSDFQTTDTKKNTQNIMQELENEKKQTLNFKYLHEFNIDNLSKDQKKMFYAISNYQLDNPTPIKVDLERGLIIDSQNNIMHINNNDGVYYITNGNDKENTNEASKKNSFQKTLTPSNNTIYSSNF